MGTEITPQFTGRLSMAGVEDLWIFVGYALSIGLAIACIIYGWLKMEKGEESNG